MQDTRVALVQMQALVGQKEANLGLIEQYVKSAAGQKADIICFPELAVTGYTRRGAFLLAEELSGETAGKLTAIANTYTITVLAGMVESQPDSRPTITQLVCVPGQAVTGYRKTHLGKSEQPFFSAGDDLPVFTTPKASFGIGICWDMHFPEVSACLALQGAEIIFTPHASPVISGNRKDLWLKYLPARAYDNAAYVAACNQVGEAEPGRRFSGGLMLVDPRGRVMAQSSRMSEEMLVVDLPAKPLNDIRYNETGSMRQNFFLSFRRPELYRKLLD